jgi:hypothetical protein
MGDGHSRSHTITVCCDHAPRFVQDLMSFELNAGCRRKAFGADNIGLEMRPLGLCVLKTLVRSVAGVFVGQLQKEGVEKMTTVVQGSEVGRQAPCTCPKSVCTVRDIALVRDENSGYTACRPPNLEGRRFDCEQGRGVRVPACH